jgi:hypothetical protein
MLGPNGDSQAKLRQQVYAVLIALGVGAMIGRILAVDSVDRVGLENYRLRQLPRELERVEKSLHARGLPEEEIKAALAAEENRRLRQARLRRPFLSANDRSRWCAVRALVEPEMRVPGAPYAIDKVIQEPNWDTIDMVKHDGHLYSSKPPLLVTLIAAEYWLLYNLTGLSLGTHPYELGRFMLVTINVIPLALYFFVLARLIERFGRSDWGRIFAMAAAVFGTFLTTFAVVLNNHVPAAVCAVLALYPAIRIWFDGERRVRYYVMAGTFAALTASNELPAVAFFVPLAMGLCWDAVVLAGMLVMRLWQQLQAWWKVDPPTPELLAAARNALRQRWQAARPAVVGFLPPAVVVVGAFLATNWIAHGTLKPPYMYKGGANNWYDYTYEREGKVHKSYWQDPQGIDKGEPRIGVYALHLLVGHHGIFSLTPIWLLTMAGLAIWLAQREDSRLRALAAGVAAMSLVCLLYYICQPQMNRNYSGMSSGFRWMFWFAPFWLLAMLPVLDVLVRRAWTRALALLLLALSVLSASYPTWNPFSHPWLMNFLKYMEWC